MYKLPLVSIILPTYNRNELLPRAIESVMAQTYPDWELIVWDDGSTIPAREIVESYNDQRIHYYWNENHGMSYALNQAIGKAQGEVIAFLDDDDIWINTKLSEQIILLKNNPIVDMVFSNYLNINKISSIKKIGFTKSDRFIKLLDLLEIDKQAYIILGSFLESIALSNYIAFDSVLIKKNAIDEIGPFNESLRNGMDLEYWWRFGLLNKKPAYVDKVLMERIKYPQSLSGRGLLSLNNHIEALDSCVELANIHKKSDLVESLHPAYRNAWQNMITACAQNGDTQGMWQSFQKSLQYGFRPGSLRLLLQGFLSRFFHQGK